MRSSTKIIRNIFMIFAVFVLAFAAKSVKAADPAYSANISTSPVTSSSGVSATWCGYTGQTFYCNVWDRNATNTMKSGSVTLKKNGTVVVGNSASQSFSMTNYCNWANFPLTLYEPGEYTYELNIKDINGNNYTGGQEFYIYDVAPVISSQPTAKTVKQGNSVTFSTSVSQGTNVKYQWYYATSSSGTGTAISGATSRTYTISSATKSMNGRYYYCRVTNYGNSVKTNSAKLTVYNPPTVTNPSAKSIKEGYTTSFSVTASGGNPSSYTYQWYSASSTSGSGTKISGATSRIYSITGSQSNNGKYYYCQVSNGQYTVTSGRARLTVYYPPTISNPYSTTVGNGGTAIFSAGAYGGNPSSYTYQWYSSDTSYGYGTVITGATSSVYTVTASSDNNGLYYYCQISNGQYTETTSRAQLTVTGLINSSDIIYNDYSDNYTDINYQENTSYENTSSTSWYTTGSYREIWIIRRENKKNKADKKNRVKLPDMQIKKIKRTKKKIQVTWKRNKKVDGYKIFMARDKKFKKCIGGVEINKNKYTQYTIKPSRKNEINLNKKKMKQIKYIQIVGWKKINGKIYYTDLNKKSLKKVR